MFLFWGIFLFLGILLFFCIFLLSEIFLFLEIFLFFGICLFFGNLLTLGICLFLGTFLTLLDSLKSSYLLNIFIRLNHKTFLSKIQELSCFKHDKMHSDGFSVLTFSWCVLLSSTLHRNRYEVCAVGRVDRVSWYRGEGLSRFRPIVLDDYSCKTPEGYAEKWSVIQVVVQDTWLKVSCPTTSVLIYWARALQAMPQYHWVIRTVIVQ